MNKYFNKIKLGELTEIIAGGDKPKIFSENKTSINTVPVFANAEGNNGLQGYTNLPRIIEPAVTISARGSKVGFAAIRKQPFFPIVRLLTLIPQKDKLDVDYLFYNLKLNRQNGTGSGQPQITIPEISEKIISVPPLLNQQKIASVLSALDAKIELNNQINAELEAMAKTLYDYWFVQFDFPDKNGKPYKSSGGKMVWNDELKREIPEGWEVKRIGEVASVKAGGDKPENYSIEQTEINKVPIYSNGITNDGLYGYTAESIINEQSVTISARGTIGFCVLRNKPFVPIIRLISLTPRFKGSAKYFYEVLKYFIFENSGSVQQQLTVPQVSSIKIIYPNEGLLKKFDELTLPMINRIEIIKEENQKLTELRDWLLPMLMNGQVTVSEAKENTLPSESLSMVVDGE